MGLFQYRTIFPLRFICRYASTTRLQVFQNAVQITDPQRIRNVGIIAHIDAGKSKNRLFRFQDETISVFLFFH